MMYNKVKKQNGEKFAQALRAANNGIFEIPEINLILRHAGRDPEDALGLIPYLMSLLEIDNTPVPDGPVIEDPLTLLDRAGYNAFHADTLEKQNSIERYFESDELLCTFNDRARYKDYYIIHAVKKNIDDIKRADFKGQERREDEYGTSVISIQIAKSGGFIKITNRYNHSVDYADNTFRGNPDNIIDGLSASLKKHFDVNFNENKSILPDGFELVGNQTFKYHEESGNIFYGDQAWIQKGRIHSINRTNGDALLGGFVFNNKNKVLRKIDSNSYESFHETFNRYYGGNKQLHISKGNLMLGQHVIIGAQESRIETLFLPNIIKMKDYCLYYMPFLKSIDAPDLVEMKMSCVSEVKSLIRCNMPKLKMMHSYCLHVIDELIDLYVPNLIDPPYRLTDIMKCDALSTVVRKGHVGLRLV